MTISSLYSGMNIGRRRFISIAAASAALAPFGSMSRSAAGHTLTWRGVALGATASLTLEHENLAAAREAIADCLTEVTRLEAIFSLHRSDSSLCQLNAMGELKEAPADLRVVLAQALSLAHRTGGAFDPTVQPLWSLYARHFEDPRAPPEGPSVIEIEKSMDCVGWRHVELGIAGVRLAKRGMAVTLNGIAQGYITDKVGDILRRSGFENVLVDMGEQLALGPKRDGSAWVASIAAPDTNGGPNSGQAVAARIPLTNGALATSGSLGTAFDPAKQLSHILDARTGRPAKTWASVSVRAPSAALADGLSTALAILPVGEAPALLGSDCSAYAIAWQSSTGSWI